MTVVALVGFNFVDLISSITDWFVLLAVRRTYHLKLIYPDADADTNIYY